MSFQDALERNPPLDRVGDVWLRFESSLFIGETRPLRSRWDGPALGLGAVGMGAIAAALALWPSGPLWLAVLLGLGAAGLTYLAERQAFRGRCPRRFVLNFATETLRLEGPASKGTASCTRLLSFDAVVGLRVVKERTGQRSLELLYAQTPQAPVESARLVSETSAAEHERLERLEHFLAGALGVRTPAQEPSRE